jgi:hypothetical protein
METLKYYESVIWKKKLGCRFSVFFVQWAQLLLKCQGKTNNDAIAVLQKVYMLELQSLHNTLIS